MSTFDIITRVRIEACRSKCQYVSSSHGSQLRTVGLSHTLNCTLTVLPVLQCSKFSLSGWILIYCSYSCSTSYEQRCVRIDLIKWTVKWLEILTPQGATQQRVPRFFTSQMCLCAPFCQSDNFKKNRM